MKLTANPALGLFHVWVGSSGAKLVRVMKLTTIIILAVCLQSSANGLAQNTVTFSGKDVNLESVFTAIKKQTSYRFFFNTSIIQNASKITIEVKNAPIDQVLNLALKDQSLTFAIKGRTIFVMKKPEEDKSSQVAPPQGDPVTVKGTVTDEQGNPLAGANVKVKGTDKGVTTDEQGRFTLSNVDGNGMLEISFVGRETLLLAVKGKTIFSIALGQKIAQLDETVVIAYGTTTRRFSTGNVTSVKAIDIEKQPVNNPLLALQGRVPGMTIIQNTGVPGGSLSIQIRGQNSINFASEPMYIIDGVQFSTQLLSNVGGGITGKIGSNGGNPLNYLNPADIESIDILKDADATAIYGSRAANGVVLITTKKGKSGKMSIDVRVYEGMGKVSKKLDLLNNDQYLEMRHEAFMNDNATPSLIDRDLKGDWDTTRYTDWQKELIGRNAQYSDAQLSLSGGNNETKYLIAGSFHKETTVFPGDFNTKKSALHFNFSSTSVDQRFNIMLSGVYVNDNAKLPRADMTQNIFGSPVAPPFYNEDGSLNWQFTSAGVLTFSNPVAQLLNKYKNTTNNLIGNLACNYNLFPGLDLKASMGYTNLSANEINMSPIAAKPPNFPASLKVGNANFVNNNIRSWIIEPQATYQVAIKKGQLNALIGSTFQQNISNNLIIAGNGYTSDLTLENIQSAPIVTVTTSTFAKYKYNAIFGRLNYNWQQRYLGNFTLRRDGSSRFGPENQFHNFYSVGGAWIFSNELFIKNKVKFLSYGKLRVNFGTTGNDQIGDYKFLDLYSNTAYPYQGGLGLYPANLFNPLLAWEETKKLEGGIDVGFFQDRIYATASIYRHRSGNQLLSSALPAMTGFPSIITNIPALVENIGYEFALSTRNILSKKFTWRTNFNLTIAKNKLKNYPDFIGSIYENRLVIGKPVTVIKVFNFQRVNPTTGIYEFGDGNGGLTTRPDTATRTTAYGLINTVPKFYGGFQNTFQYRDFELDILFQFVKQIGQQFLVNPNLTPPGRFSVLNNQPVSVLDRWKKTGDATIIQKYSQKSTSDVAVGYTNMLNSDLAYGDASFIRLKNVSLSYQLPQSFRNKLHLKNFRIYFQGQNLLTITNYKGLDPETQSVTSLPPLRVLTFGVNITL
ncbi:TonB-dependent receptor plug [Niastella koreensis GR20-10]|uniref:TonB-dependent receptor plug n=2 Tax=Niastella koreensis TaxID=354356 RepID=G8T8P2_NIAKG|nr:TonB-dependent receptor plug [Niastella koreensis GR20-10]